MKGKKQYLFAVLVLVLSPATDSVWAVGKPTANNEDIPKCYKSTNSEMAISYCTQAIESGQLSGKGLAFAFYKRANGYYERGQYDRAIEDYNHVIGLNPNHADAFSNRGATYARKGEYDRAIESYDEAIRLNPKHADAFSNRGVAYARKGDYDRAVENYDEAIRLNPKHAAALYGRGNAYRRKGDYDRAIENYDEAIRSMPMLCIIGGMPIGIREITTGRLRIMTKRSSSIPSMSMPFLTEGSCASIRDSLQRRYRIFLEP